MKIFTFREALLLVANAAKRVAAAVQYMTCYDVQAWCLQACRFLQGTTS
jgi:hypothetical protein